MIFPPVRWITDMGIIRNIAAYPLFYTGALCGRLSLDRAYGALMRWSSEVQGEGPGPWLTIPTRGGWNYRIIDHGEHLALHEVYYDGAGRPVSYTEDAVSFVTDPELGVEDLAGGLKLALLGTKKPVLKVGDFAIKSS